MRIVLRTASLKNYFIMLLILTLSKVWIKVHMVDFWATRWHDQRCSISEKNSENSEPDYELFCTQCSEKCESRNWFQQYRGP